MFTECGPTLSSANSLRRKRSLECSSTLIFSRPRIPQQGNRSREDKPAATILTGRVTQSDPNTTDSTAENNMKRPNVFHYVAAALALASQANAQTAPTFPSEKEQPVVELSPFQVNAKDEKGYAATSSL